MIPFALLAMLQTQEWTEDLEGAPAAGRPVCLLVHDERFESQKTIQWFDREEVRSIAARFTMVKLDSAKPEAKALGADWLPAVYLLEPVLSRRTPPLSDKDKKVQEKLSNLQVTLAFEDSSLGEVTDYLRELTKLEIVLGANEDPEISVTVNVQGATLEKALAAVLQPQKLGFVVDQGVVWIMREAELDRYRRGKRMVASRFATLVGKREATEQDRKLMKVLERKVDLDFDGADLKEVVQYLNDLIEGDPIVVDRSVTEERSVVMKVRDLAIERALALLLAMQGLKGYYADGKYVLAPRLPTAELEGGTIAEFLAAYAEPEASELSGEDRAAAEQAVTDLSGAKGEDAVKKLRGMGVKARRILRAAHAKSKDPVMRDRIERVFLP